MWLHGAMEWWLMGLAQMKQTSASPSVPSFCVSSLDLKFCSLPVGAGFASASVDSAGWFGAGAPEWCGPPRPLPPLPRPRPRPLPRPL